MLDFYKGMDLSFVPEFEERGMVIRDFDKTPVEAVELAARYGVNAVRLRLWNEPSNVPESGGYCDLAHTIAMAKRIKAQKLQFMLDFHYSDWWADPGKQTKPKAWEKLSFEELVQAVYDYTKETLLALRSADVMPDMVQIGNEIRSGLLFPDGEAPDFTSMTKLVNAGIQAAREVGGDGLDIMIHLDQGGRYFYLKEWFDKAFAAGLADFDAIGLSYYPFWHGNFLDLKETMELLVKDYHKPIIIAETAHAWHIGEDGFIDAVQERIAGVEATPEGQRRVLELVMDICASLPEHMGRGIFYWEPFCIPMEGEGGWAANMGLLAPDGTAMEGVRAFAFERRAKEYHEGRVCQPKLETKEQQLALADSDNLLQNPGWEEGLEHWQIERDADTVIAARHPEFVDPFPAPPVNALRVESAKNFTFCVSQQAKIDKAGQYGLRVHYKGADTTGVDVRLFLEQGGQRTEAVIHPTEHDWQEIVVQMQLSEGPVLAGVKITAPPVYGMMKNFALFSLE